VLSGPLALSGFNFASFFLTISGVIWKSRRMLSGFFEVGSGISGFGSCVSTEMKKSFSLSACELGSVIFLPFTSRISIVAED